MRISSRDLQEVVSDEDYNDWKATAVHCLTTVGGFFPEWFDKYKDEPVARIPILLWIYFTKHGYDFGSAAEATNEAINNRS